MQTTCYLVLAKTSKGTRVRRATQARPRLDFDEAFVRVRLELPEGFWADAPVTVAVAPTEVAVAIETEDLTEQEED